MGAMDGGGGGGVGWLSVLAKVEVESVGSTDGESVVSVSVVVVVGERVGISAFSFSSVFLRFTVCADDSGGMEEDTDVRPP